ncbi:MAG TPA: hypothetical protein VGD10_03560 [Allosphingosinicella sp.]|uniref:hypothetical protein n=1 Tax=Allosphingosinicella sp. TaxID=2823234 RepID=UPI002EDB83F8
MSKPKLGLGSRLVIGGIAGFVGTLAMTAAMRRMHQKLPAEERYPLTPREIIDSAGGEALPDEATKDVTTAAHFAYGAASGSLLGAISPRTGPAGGALAGVGIWLASYMGWIPAARILKPATEHPRRRNLLMIGAHLVWGAATALSMRELRQARETMGRSRQGCAGG